MAHIGIAKVFVAKKQRRKARKAIKKALETEPANAEALELKKKLR
jgi:hypothetical protein